MLISTEFPQFPVDLVIVALLDHQRSSPILEQTLTAVEWANDNKAPVLAIDPCEFNAVLGNNILLLYGFNGANQTNKTLNQSFF